MSGSQDHSCVNCVSPDADDTCRSPLPEDDPVLSYYIPLQLARELVLQRYPQYLSGKCPNAPHLLQQLQAAQ
ncbi:MAG: hypothetical protein F6K00_31070 [Leptolyngbya sp. SIOISBB]|nr:hypothetical protein [Leptolyngbya sp. SIOISBB]